MATNDFSNLFSAAESKYGIPSAILQRLVKLESNGNPKARSPAGAQGVTQFMPATAKQYNVDVNDPESSINGTAEMLSDLKKKYNGNMNAALAHYNGGAYNAEREMTGADAANPLKVSAANNQVNKNYVAGFKDLINAPSNDTVLGDDGSTGAALPVTQPVAQTQLKPLDAFSAGAPQAPAMASTASPMPNIANPYEGTAQMASNPSNPLANSISAGDPSAVKNAQDEFMKRYQDSRIGRAIGQGLSGFGGGGASDIAAAQNVWKDIDNKNYQDTVGRVTMTQDAAKKAQDLANASQNTNITRTDANLKIPALSNESNYAKSLGDASSLQSSGIRNAILQKMKAAGVPVPSELGSMDGVSMLKTYGQYVPDMAAAYKVPAEVSSTFSKAKSDAELAKQAGQTTAVGNVAVNAAQAPPSPLRTVTTSGTNVTTGPSAASTARDVAGAGIGSTQTASNANSNAQRNSIDQLRSALGNVKPYQNTPGAKIYDFINPGQKAALDQLVASSSAMGIPAPAADAPQNVWKNFIERMDGQLLLNQKKEQARQASIGTKTDAQFESEWNANSPMVYINPKNGVKIAVPRDVSPADRKRLLDSGAMPLNAYEAATVFQKGQ